MDHALFISKQTMLAAQMVVAEPAVPQMHRSRSGLDYECNQYYM